MEKGTCPEGVGLTPWEFSRNFYVVPHINFARDEAFDVGLRKRWRDKRGMRRERERSGLERCQEWLSRILPTSAASKMDKPWWGSIDRVIYNEELL